MIYIPLSQWKAFEKQYRATGQDKSGLRYGQAFFNYANLHKCTPTPWLDRLYNAPDVEAFGMILDAIDLDQ